MITLPDYIVQFMEIFTKNGYQIYVVGGAVRDLLLKKEVKNWDFTTSAAPEEILKLFPHAFYHNTYGTVTVPYDERIKHSDSPTKSETFSFEITPFRKESNYSDVRHPDTIEWATTLEEDLSRRDFTINAMALGFSANATIIDPYQGQKHLKQNVVVAVGDPDKRFSEDALRLMRAVRISAQLGFLIEEKTRLSIQKNAELITNISWERIRDELFKILASDHPAEGILFLHNTGLLKHILPEVELCFLVPQKSPKRHHVYDVGTHLVMSLKYCPSRDFITRFATLLHDIGKAQTFRRDEQTGIITFYNHEVAGEKMAAQIADRLKLSNEQKQKLVTLVAKHQFTVSELQTDKAVKRFIREVGIENIEDILAVRTGDRIGSGATPTSWRLDLFKKRLIEVQKEPFKITDLKVNGDDVMAALHIKPGPQIGKILKSLFESVENGELKNEREILLQKLHTLDAHE